MSRMHIRMNAEGRWEIVDGDAKMLDFASVNGTWVNCFGTVSPWNTPLTSEELYFPNTSEWNNPNYDVEWNAPDPLSQYFPEGTYANPYDYGYIVEIKTPTKDPTPQKRYAMGRFSHENSVVMPDNKTVYMSDDGTGTVFFKFVADEPGDLSSGTLYAAKAHQAATDIPAEASFKIEWIELAHASDAEVAQWVRAYDGIDKSDYKEGESSYVSDQEIEAWANGNAEDDRAAFLESRKAAAAKGATDEFRKMEGVNINYRGAMTGDVPFMYMAMSEVNQTMADEKGDIELQPNTCGVVYRMKLTEDYNVTHMVPVIAGGPFDKNNAENVCSIENIANPDNLVVMNDGRVIVGEDTGLHENNMLWVYDPEA
jgi:secreted PhoX family phosphatase